jgi:predicted PurR-regulated permease PerM
LKGTTYTAFCIAFCHVTRTAENEQAENFWSEVAMPKFVPLIVLGLVTLGLGYEFYTILSPFLLPLFLAGVLAMLADPLHQWFKARYPKQPSVAAGLTTATVIAVVLLPFALATVLAAGQLIQFTRSAFKDPAWQKQIAQLQASPWVAKLRTELVHQLGIEPAEGEPEPELRVAIEERLKASAGWIAQRTLGAAGTGVALASSLASFTLAGFTLVLAFYYFLADGPALWAAFEQQVPVSKEHIRQLFTQFESAVRGVVFATLAAAIAQGVVTALAVWLCGLSGFFLFVVLGTISALIPVAGTWVVWIPAAIYLFVTGSTVKAVLLTLFCVIVVGLLDNVVRTYVLNSNVELHPVLAFVSVLGGLQALGLWGVFIGPVIASCLFAALQIFNQELSTATGERAVPEARPAATA